MSAPSPGAPRWWALSIIAISLTALLVCAMPARAQGLKRLHDTSRALALGPVPALAVLRARCGADILCAARVIAASIGPRARLERVIHPDTDTIRRVRNRVSVTRVIRRAPGVLRIRLDHFGRRAGAELLTAMTRAGEPPVTLEIDLRGNGGGDLRRMLRAAALFAGPVKDVLRLRMKGATRSLSLPAPRGRITAEKLIVLTGPRTASSAEVFAAILRTRLGARIMGARTWGKNWLLSAIPVNNDWRLFVPSAIMRVPGARLDGGLVPDIALDGAGAAPSCRGGCALSSRLSPP